MNYNIRKFVICFVIIVVIVNIATAYFSSYNPEESTGFNDYARITDVEYQAIILDEETNGGSAHITEKLTFDVHAARKDNLFWELWRALPEQTIDGLRVDYEVLSVKQINPDGTEIVYEESPKLYWYDSDYTDEPYGPYKWYHSMGPYNEYLRRYECVLFYVDGLYREEVTYEIEYIMHNAAFKYSDVSELYLSMYSEETIKYLDSFKGEILIKNSDMPSRGNYIAHTYGTNNGTFTIEESSTKNPGYYTFSFDLDKDDLKFRSYNQYLEFTLLSFNEDYHKFTDYAPDNDYSWDVYLEEAKENMTEYDSTYTKINQEKPLYITGAIVISLFLFIYIVYRDKNIRTKYLAKKPNQEILYYRDIPSKLDPYFAATLVFAKSRKKVNMDDIYSALLLNLVRKGYIELKTIDGTNNYNKQSNVLINILYTPNKEAKTIYNTSLNDALKKNAINNNSNVNKNTLINIPKINKNGKMLEDLTPNEEAYFNFINNFAVGGSISLNDFQSSISRNINTTEAFVTRVDNSIKTIGMNKNYFKEANYDKYQKSTNNFAKTYIILAASIMILGNFAIYHNPIGLTNTALLILSISLLICAFLLNKFAKKYALLTEFGEEEYIKWYALYNFLNSATLMNEKQVVELPLWEEYLVYATAFGISDKVIKALKINCPDLTNSVMLSNNYYLSHSFITYNRAIRHTTYRAYRSSVHSRSYGSFGGGSSFYGGGGRGGGGGGGGH